MNTDTRTLAVIVVSANDSGSLKPGMMVNAKILFDKSKEKSIVISNNAVITKGEKSFVYLEHDDYYQASDLKLGFQDSSGIEVLEGLVEGDLIVVQGGEQIYSESLLKKGSSHHHDHGAEKSTNKIPWSILISVLLSSILTSAFWFFRRRGNK